MERGGPADTWLPASLSAAVPRSASLVSTFMYPTLKKMQDKDEKHEFYYRVKKKLLFINF